MSLSVGGGVGDELAPRVHHFARDVGQGCTRGGVGHSAAHSLLALAEAGRGQ